MADFDAFETADQPPQTQEEDPAAAFLAREQTELAGLEDDNFGVENPPAQEQTDFDPFSGGQEQTNAGQGDMFGDEGQDTENDQWLQEHTMQENIAGTGTNGPSDAYAAISQVDTERQEPEVITKWREEQKMRLEKKDVEEEEKKQEWKDMAKKELDDWYKHHSEQLDKTKDNNSAAEAAFTKERDETQPGGEWEKICRFCEFNPKNSKTTKDVSRMRSILLQLKQTPLVR